MKIKAAVLALLIGLAAQPVSAQVIIGGGGKAGSGTVTSVALSFPNNVTCTVSGSPITTSGTLVCTPSGTSGGIPYFSSASALSSSAALTANAPVIGGGAGAAPSVGSRSGNTTEFATVSGALTSGHATVADVSGNIVDSGAAPGTGTVSSVTCGAGLSGGTITTSGTCASTETIRAVTSTTDTILSTDAAKLVTYSNASAIAVTLPQATGSFAVGFGFSVQNLGAGLVTVTPTTSTVNGAALLPVPQGYGCDFVSDGTNWQISACTASVQAVTLTGAQSIAGQKSNNITTLSISTATFTPDGSNNNYGLTLVHASCPCTLANPSVTPVAGTSGVIEVVQSATGSDAITTWGSDYIYPGGTSTIALSTAASAIDVLSYYVIDPTHILLTTGALHATH